ncbi:MAG: sigma-54-dependent Fis family transcriptional regulator [Ignavibacteriales bacterium]|nr:sigma-54-dependent Fis family transcriptional regulator [Ignavibacteriales bacterium]
MNTILVVDDEKSVRESIKLILEYEGYSIHFAENGPQALAKVQGGDTHLVLLDVKMAGMDGLEVLQKIREKNQELPVVMISGHGTIETAVEATKLGAFDFLPKPLDRDKLIITVRNALDRARLTQEYRSLQERVEGRLQLLGESAKIREILALIARVASTDARVLITGENGTGKELVARAIHRQSKRADKQFVEVNCAAIPAELIESELFGHEKGSFTGATAQRIGKFEQANGGTLFLDEIGDMSLNAQAKVLRALEEGKIERVGGTKLISVDVRVLAATNKNIEAAVKNGLFREDLYHRLKVIPIHVPSLREHREDIPVLVRAFIDDVCARNGMAGRIVSPEAMKKLEMRDWPGNVRELRNAIERLVILSPGLEVDMNLLDAPAAGSSGEFEDILGKGGTFQEFKERAEAAFIKRQLDRHRWNISKTAEALDIQRSHLYTKMKRYGLMKEEEEARDVGK